MCSVIIYLYSIYLLVSVCVFTNTGTLYVVIDEYLISIIYIHTHSLYIIIIQYILYDTDLYLYIYITTYSNTLVYYHTISNWITVS